MIGRRAHGAGSAGRLPLSVRKAQVGVAVPKESARA